ncbi:O-acetylserine/cysteine efflux transporter [Sinobacterium caligoides]|uniref:O-acetylserine/cysteine efflux transporter n=1 Tax=Sinobacterium caligoides TaxID=933926 RepID=A0A3N2DDL7_9GAMM|nr:EamA family transporter [Sinobacterium caligoides]ROR97891.1 O-acetylserine/cysteine efflux transporter [Sinobacterium caligoides]
MTKFDTLIAVMITATWGFNFSLLKVSTVLHDPWLVAFMRFFLCAVPFCFFVPKPNLPWHKLALYGSLFGGAFWGMVNLGIVLGVSAGMASLLVQFTAFSSVVLGVIYFKESFGLSKKIGCSVALMSVLSMLLIADGSVSIFGVCAILFAAVACSLSNVVLKELKTDNLLSLLVYGCGFASMALLVICVFTGALDNISSSLLSQSDLFYFAILFQAYIGTLLTYWLWNGLICKYELTQVVPMCLLVPVFGMAASSVFFDETIGVFKLAACALLIVGLVIIFFGTNIYLWLANSKQSRNNANS